MKKLIAAAFSLFLFTSSFAQENDEDGILNEKIGRHNSEHATGHYTEGEGGGAHEGHWSHLTTIALSPFQYTESGVGVGLSYERALDHDGILSVYVPAIASFRLRTNNNYNYYYGGSNSTNYLFTLMPGVKFYPTGMGKVKYAVGPNAVIGYGQRSLYDYPSYDPMLYSSSYYAPYYGTYTRWMLGMMINNSLNVNATPHLYIGAEMGFGFTYFDNIGGINYGVKFLTQGAFKIGYTF